VPAWVAGGVGCGWVERNIPDRRRRFGTLLGPEGTSVVDGRLGGSAAPGSGCLTHCVVGVVVAVVGWGVVVC